LIRDAQALFVWACLFACAIARVAASPARELPVGPSAAILPAQDPQATSRPGACPAVPEHTPTEAETEYSQRRYDRAEYLYGQELAQHPGDLKLSAAMVHTLLREGEIERASAQVAKAMAADPHSAIALTARAELELKRGEPWLALETLAAAETGDPCYARAYLIRGRALRLNSMYGSERAEIEKAYAIDPNDPDIKHGFLSVVARAKEIAGIEEALATMKDLDSETRQKAQESIDSMLPMLSENTQTCKVVPALASSITLPLLPTFQDAKHIDGYKLEVQLPQSKARLQVDTAASGLFITRALADSNGLQPGKDDPQGTVRLDRIQIGPLEFRNCLVGVSETPFAEKSDGFIGTDIFSSYLITLDQPGTRLELAPLPQTGSLLPVDRPSSASLPAELKDFTPVYHRQQYLLVPVMLDGKARRLFILDSGIRFSTMRSEVAHLVSTTRVNFTNAMQTVSGSTLQVYRDSFDFQLANLSLNQQSHILQMDTAAIDQNAGMQMAGMLGFDMLHSFVVHLDYRDGLVKLESHDAGVTGAPAAGGLIARKAANQDCNDSDSRDRPLNTTLQAQVVGLLDSGRLKLGQEVTVKLVKGWSDDECTLSAGDLLYGHVTSAGCARSPDSSELSLMFDRAQCDRGARPLKLRLIAVVAAPDQFVGMHTALPSQVAGAGRSISNLAGGTGLNEDINLNPTGPPHTVHPGVVVGMPTVELDPLGGPGCSARIFSSDKNVRLGVGVQLLFTRQSAH
jgi:Flp pilus assembly protein TadD